jgi:regulator of nucleoside diphosphate kinase
MASDVLAKPPIVVSDRDHEHLTRLADGLAQRHPVLAEMLRDEMDRATVLPLNTVPREVVQMGSLVEFRLDTGETKRATLIFSGKADFAEGQVSILTPLGTALIGLSPGQSMTWTSRDGREHRLTVVSVEQQVPVPAG